MTLRDEAIQLHLENNGKIKVVSKVPIVNRHDLSLAYTPGVAEPCKDIKEDKNLSFEYTCRGNMIAVVSDGTRVLGLGDIGPEAGIPVMEGKAALFKTFADVDAVPVCLGTKDPEEIIKTVKYLEPNYSGINLEDISSPKCYDIEDRLKEICDIPVFHDDQHGTAIACLSAGAADRYHYLGLCLHRPECGHGSHWPLYLSDGALPAGSGPAGAPVLSAGSGQMQYERIPEQMEKSQTVEIQHFLRHCPFRRIQSAAGGPGIYRCRQGRLHYRHVHRSDPRGGSVPGQPGAEVHGIQCGSGRGGSVPHQLSGCDRNQQG